MINDIVEAVRSLVMAIGTQRRPESIPVLYPAHSAAAGIEAGTFLLSTDEKGGVKYIFHPATQKPTFESPCPELERSHVFGEVGALKDFLASIHTDQQKPAVFVHGHDPAALSVLIDELHPEIGQLGMVVPRHPAWKRWFGAFKDNDVLDLSHTALADLLIDNREDLIEPALAKVVSAFHAARTIEYSADLETASSVGVRVTWKGSTTSDPKATDTSLPRSFGVRVPPYIGVWIPGEEPKLDAAFRLRVIPSKDPGDAAPKFRLSWINRGECNQAGIDLIVEQVTEVFGSVSPVYAGKPDSARFVVPILSNGKTAAKK